MSDSARAQASGADRPDGAARAARKQGKSRQPERRGLIGRVTLFVRQVIAELKKVVQPTRQELIQFTSVVLVFVAVMMAFITVVDLGAGSLIGWVFG